MSEKKMSELEAFLRSKRAWTRYKKNVKANGRDLDKLLSKEVGKGILYGFSWELSPEKYAFWNALFWEASDVKQN